MSKTLLTNYAGQYLLIGVKLLENHNLMLQIKIKKIKQAKGISN